LDRARGLRLDDDIGALGAAGTTAEGAPSDAFLTEDSEDSGAALMSCKMLSREILMAWADNEHKKALLIMFANPIPASCTSRKFAHAFPLGLPSERTSCASSRVNVIAVNAEKSGAATMQAREYTSWQTARSKILSVLLFGVFCQRVNSIFEATL
jgi:hypothetical protein